MQRMKIVKLGLELYPQDSKDNALFGHCIGEKGIPRWRPSIRSFHKDGLEAILKAHGETLEIVEHEEEQDKED